VTVVNIKRKATLSCFGTGLMLLFTVLTVAADPDESVREISVTRGNAFTISLRSNPSTGYRWSAKFDKGFVHLKEESFKRPENSLLGSPGQQTFIFVANETGVTDIDLVYSRPWEKVFAERRIYRVRISK
jgi:predicted secreted protein